MSSRTALLPALVAFSAALPASAQAPKLFDAPRFVLEPQGGSVRELGDYDGDGDLDLIHVLGKSQTEWSGFRLLTNDGNAFFTAGLSTPFPVPGGPSATEFCARAEPPAGDFDGDGNLDIAFDHFEDVFGGGGVGGIEVYFGDGQGGFSAPVNTGVATASVLVAGQADLDAAVELAVIGQDLSGQSFLWWFHWNGAAFQPSAPLPLGHGGDPGNGLVEGLLLDIDGDGLDDFVGRSQDFARLRVFPTVGGQFTYGQLVALTSDFVTANARVTGGDLDADGDPDALVIQRQTLTYQTPTFSAHRNEGGTLVQLSPQDFIDGGILTTDFHLQVRDWDGDGRNDVLEYAHDLLLFRDVGGFFYGAGGKIRLGSKSTEAGAGDLDGDGRLDVAAADSVYLGSGVMKSVPSSGSGEDMSVVASCMFAEDRDGDGDLDIVAPSGNHAIVRVNDAAGKFSTVDEPKPALPPTFLVAQARAYADFDLDGRRDWLIGMFQEISMWPPVTVFVEMVWMLDNGAGGYTLGAGATPPGVNIPAPSAPLHQYPLGDIDGDGDQDLLTSNGHWENHGTGFGAATVPSFLGDAHDALDFDGDGDLDILAVDIVGAPDYAARLLLQQPGGTFASQVLSTWSGTAPAWMIRPLAFFRDLDLDGDADILTGPLTGGATAVHENVGGAPVPRGTLPMAIRSKMSVAVEDVDGDGLQDLYGIGVAGPAVFGPASGPAWFRRVGPGLTYATPIVFKSFAAAGGFLDVDGDSDIDCVSALPTKGIEHVEPTSGKKRQYGQGMVGSGGAIPVLGVSGPMWSGGASPVERVRRGLGGAPVILIFGFYESSFPLQPFLILYTNPNIFGTFTLSGPPGVPGAGAFDFPLPTGPWLGGLRVYKQAFVIDFASPSGLASHTNGLELVWGF